jgi:ketosteroid isomerase-like protein
MFFGGTTIMKKSKVLAAIAAAALAMSAMSLPAYAAGDVIDFEDGDISFAQVKLGDSDGDDGATLTVEDFNGSKQLKITTADATKVNKVQFNVEQMYTLEDLGKIARFTMEMTVASQDGVTAPGWQGGVLMTQGGQTEDPNPPQGQTSFDAVVQEYTNPVSAMGVIERKYLIPAQRFVSEASGQWMLFMRWSNAVPADVYLDNITAYDADGNIVAPTIGAAAAPVAAEAPAADAATTSAATGNTPAIVLASVCLIAGGAALVTRKRK